MNRKPERRQDSELRSTIEAYERQAQEMRAKAGKEKSAAERAKLTALADSLTELANALRDRPPGPVEG